MAGNWNAVFDGTDALTDAMQRYGQGAGRIIQGVYEDFAAEKIGTEILKRVHPSGRTFKGHRQGAQSAGVGRVFKHAISGLSLTVESTGNYGYLYFPDTGVGHQPRTQDFSGKGLEASADAIIERCVAKLNESF